jgi:hypothetical protein
VNTLGLPPDEFDALVSQRRSEQFLAACRLPGMWLDRAFLHKRGADLLYERAYAAWQRNFARDLAESRQQPANQSTSRSLEGEELDDFNDQRLLAEYLLLIGYAIECLLKGYLLAAVPELVVDEKRIDRLVAVHDLPQLCHECSIVLELEETRLLKLVTRHITWGKYTAPLTVRDMPSWIHPNDQEEKSLAVSNPFHERRVQVLADGVFLRAHELLNKQRT